MSGRARADVVFCIDSSDSMSPCIDGVRNHISSFVAELEGDQQRHWDLRLDFVSHCAGVSPDGSSSIFYQRSVYNKDTEVFINSLYRGAEGKFFTNSVDEFKQGLSEIEVGGDEATLIALDSSLDFPWRDAAECHRVVVLMTDEPIETGVAVNDQKSMVSALINKIQALRVMLFIVAPESPTFDALAAADKSEYEEAGTNGDGLANVDFKQILAYVGKSVSIGVGQQQGKAAGPVQKGLFGQATWGVSTDPITGS